VVGLRATSLTAPASTDSSGGAGLLDRVGPGWAPLGVVAALLVAVTIRDPHQSGSWLVCPTRALLGVDCPGCGSLRGLHDLGQGDIGAAMGHNILLIPGILFFVYAVFRRPGSRWAVVWGVAFVLFTIVRNLPGSPLAA